VLSGGGKKNALSDEKEKSGVEVLLLGKKLGGE